MQEVNVFDADNRPLLSLVQWDRNIQIYIKESEITQAHDVHFFNRTLKKAYVVHSTYNNGVLSTKIPNSLLEKSLPIIGYVNVADNEEERSLYGFRIYVRERAKHSDYIHVDTEDYVTLSSVSRECAEYAAIAKESADKVQAASDLIERLEEYKSTVDYINNNANALADLHDTVTTADAIVSSIQADAENGRFNGVDGVDGADGEDGVTPHIGDNGNWFIGEEDTGLPSRGEKGSTSVLSINDAGNWVIDGVDTGHSSKGIAGDSPEISIGDDGNWVIDGENTGKSSKGDVGRSPDISIGENGNWFVDDVDTGRPSQVVNLDDDSNWADRIIALETAISDLQYESIKITSFRAEPTKFLYTNIDVEPDYLDARPVLYFSFSKTPKNATIDNYELTEHDIGEGRVTMALSSQTDHTYTLTAEDERGTRVSAKTSVKFCNYTYYGISADENLTNLRVLTNVWEIAKTTFTVTANEGEYIWFALPARMGERNFKVGGFDGGFSLISTISFDNGNSFAPGIVGYVEDYYKRSICICKSGQLHV